jgi:hypothetical protein
MATYDQTNPEIIGLQEQKALARALLKQGMEQNLQGQMVSGRFVGASPLQGLANMLNIYAGKSMAREAAQKEQDILQAQQMKQNANLQQGLNEFYGTPEFTQQGPTKTGGNIPVQPATQPDRRMALATLLAPEGGATSKAIASKLIEKDFEAPKTPESILKYNFAKTPEGGNFKGSLADFENQMNDYQRADLAIKRQAQLNQGNGANLTEFQGKATNFGIQMAGSIGEMAAVEKSGFNPATSKNQALLSISGTTAGNYLVPPEVQRYKQGMDNFTESYIRFKSGANVPMHEIEKDLKNMMPQPGDLPDKLEQKQRARERALQGMAISAGPGARFISEAYKIEAPGMKNEKPAAPAANAKATPSLWGKATVVQEGN